MSSIDLVTKNVWTELTSAVKGGRLKSIVAVAYFGQNGANMLPLSKGSILLVDASINSLKKGNTCPEELLKLYYKGVRIYSLENLHSKLYVIGKTLYCGSANVSGYSAKNLKETFLKTTDEDSVANAIKYIKSFCRIELGDDEITRMKKFYNPPKFFGGPKNENNDNAEFHICKLSLIEYSEEEEEQAEKGREVANKNRSIKSRHRVDEFLWTREINFKKGDTILQIVKEDAESYVSPVGKLIHIRKWSNGNKTKYFCFVEVPDKRRKNLEVAKKQLNEWNAKSILRGGKKNVELETNIKALWK